MGSGLDAKSNNRNTASFTFKPYSTSNFLVQLYREVSNFSPRGVNKHEHFANLIQSISSLEPGSILFRFNIYIFIVAPDGATYYLVQLYSEYISSIWNLESNSIYFMIFCNLIKPLGGMVKLDTSRYSCRSGSTAVAAAVLVDYTVTVYLFINDLFEKHYVEAYM